MTEVTVIIVSFNTRLLLARCLHTTLEALPGAESRVVVVDNGSLDGSIEMVRAEFPDVTLIEIGANIGFAAANNVALRALATPYALLLNSDTEVEPGAIRELVGCAERHRDAGAVGPLLINADGSVQRSCWRFPTLQRALYDALLLPRLFPRVAAFDDYHGWPHNRERQVDFVIGAALLVRKAAVDGVGLLDEDFFMYGEESDWLFRMRKAGWAAYFTPSGRVLHHGGASSAAIPEQIFDYVNRGRDRFYRKHYGLGGLLIFRVLFMSGLCARLLIASASAPRSAEERQPYIRMLRWCLRHIELS